MSHRNIVVLSISAGFRHADLFMVEDLDYTAHYYVRLADTSETDRRVSMLFSEGTDPAARLRDAIEIAERWVNRTEALRPQEASLY